MIKASLHFKNERLSEIYRLSVATFYDCINTIYQFIKPFLDNKMSIFKEYGAFKDIRIKVYSVILDMSGYLGEIW